MNPIEDLILRAFICGIIIPVCIAYGVVRFLDWFHGRKKP